MSGIAAALAAGLALDALFGEPDAIYRRAPHPVVLCGRFIHALDRRLNSGAFRRAKGAASVLLLVLGGGAIGWALAAAPFGIWLEALAAAVLIAQRSLADHCRDVANGLRRSLEDGRAAVSRIVGRDPDAMGESDVARAAVESAAENFSDGVVAPAFWFLLAGAPGLLIYKAVNTADSMIGHRTERHEAFGWAAARLDDALNFAPARISALLIAAAHVSATSVRTSLRDARTHVSPNAGWPEAAMAGALGVALSGPRSYGGNVRPFPWINPTGRRDMTAEDVDDAVAALWRAWTLLLAATLALALLA